MSYSTNPDAGAFDQAQVEFTHMFVEGDGGAMIEALLDGFSSSYPNLDVSEARITEAYELILKSRILNKEAPDVFFGWPGNALKPYVEAGVVLDITDLWEDNRLANGYVDSLVEFSTFDGTMRCVPTTIHRINNLFYNVEAAQRRGIDPQSISDMWDFVELVEQAHGEGLAGFGLPMKNPWTATMMWGQVLLGHLGADAFMDIYEGNADQYRGQLEETFELLDRLADLGFDEPTFVGMGEANERFMDGEVMFFQQGDWVAGAYAERDGFDYQHQWEHVPFPGTDDTYVMGGDAMVGSAQTDNPEGARALLAYTASTEALKTINRIKGSIPPRQDVSLSGYPPFLQSQYDDFKRTRHQVPAVKALATPEAGVEQLAVAASFITERDTEAAARGMIDVHTW